MPGEIYYMTQRTELRELVKKSKAVIVDFTATWCGPCKRAKPFIMDFFDNNKNTFDLVMVDVDKGSDICSAMKVISYPTFYSFINGEVTCEQTIISFISQCLSKKFFIIKYAGLKLNDFEFSILTNFSSLK